MNVSDFFLPSWVLLLLFPWLLPFSVKLSPSEVGTKVVNREGEFPRTLNKTLPFFLKMAHVWWTNINHKSHDAELQPSRLPSGLPWWVGNLGAACRLSLPSLSAALRRLSFPATSKQKSVDWSPDSALRTPVAPRQHVNQVPYLDDVLSGNWFGLFGCGCDVLQGVRQSIQGGVCSGFQLNKHGRKKKNI